MRKDLLIGFALGRAMRYTSWRAAEPVAPSVRAEVIPRHGLTRLRWASTVRETNERQGASRRFPNIRIGSNPGG